MHAGWVLCGCQPSEAFTCMCMWAAGARAAPTLNTRATNNAVCARESVPCNVRSRSHTSVRSRSHARRDAGAPLALLPVQAPARRQPAAVR